jgi:hypothetical protein
MSKVALLAHGTERAGVAVIAFHFGRTLLGTSTGVQNEFERKETHKIGEGGGEGGGMCVCVCED